MNADNLSETYKTCLATAINAIADAGIKPNTCTLEHHQLTVNANLDTGTYSASFLSLSRGCTVTVNITYAGTSYGVSRWQVVNMQVAAGGTVHLNYSGTTKPRVPFIG